MTLKGVGDRIGRTHANLLHHFGSAAGLQKALAEYLVADICNRISEAMLAERDDDADRTSELVDFVFDVVGQSGSGALVAWLLLSGNEDGLVPVMEELKKLVVRLEDFSRAAEMTLIMVLLAMADARLGQLLTEALRLPRETTRNAAEYLLRASAEHYRQADLAPGEFAPGPSFADYERARQVSNRESGNGTAEPQG